MIPSLLRYGTYLTLLGACTASMGCNNPSSPPAAVYIQATVGPTAAQTCPQVSTKPVLDVGTGTGGTPTTVDDQGNGSSGQVSVTCTVHPSGNGFDVDLETNMQGTQGGSVVITTPSGDGRVTTGTSTGVTAHFLGNMTGGPYVDTNCTITYTYMGSDINLSPLVAAGRIWGHIDCPHAQDRSQMKTQPDGGVGPAECFASADFLFENCQQ